MKKKSTIKFLDEHTINIQGPKPHAIVLVSNGSQGIRLHFSSGKNSVRTPTDCGEIINEYQLKMTITDAQCSVHTLCSDVPPLKDYRHSACLSVSYNYVAEIYDT